MGGPGSGPAGRSRKLGAQPCERLKGPVGLCLCPGCSMRRAAAVERVGIDFPSLGALLVRAAVEGA